MTCLAQLNPTVEGGLVGLAVVIIGGIALAAVKMLGNRKKNGVSCPIPEHVEKLEDYERRLTEMGKDIHYLVVSSDKSESKLDALNNAIQGMRLEMVGCFGKTRGK